MRVSLRAYPPGPGSGVAAAGLGPQAKHSGGDVVLQDMDEKADMCVLQQSAVDAAEVVMSQCMPSQSAALPAYRKRDAIGAPVEC